MRECESDQITLSKILKEQNSAEFLTKGALLLPSFHVWTTTSADKDALTSSFPVCIPFVSFTCLTVPARTSSRILNPK